MANVLVTWTTAKVNVPVTTDLTQYKVDLSGVGSTFVAFGVPLNAEFKDVPPGDYVVSVALSNDDGSHTDFSKSANFNVPISTTSLDAPDVITVEVS